MQYPIDGGLPSKTRNDSSVQLIRFGKNTNSLGIAPDADGVDDNDGPHFTQKWSKLTIQVP